MRIRLLMISKFYPWDPLPGAKCGLVTWSKRQTRENQRPMKWIGSFLDLSRLVTMLLLPALVRAEIALPKKNRDSTQVLTRSTER
jgi:hypothetical protein